MSVTQKPRQREPKILGGEYLWTNDVLPSNQANHFKAVRTSESEPTAQRHTTDHHCRCSSVSALRFYREAVIQMPDPIQKLLQTFCPNIVTKFH